MKNFNISVKDARDHKWYSVDKVSFKWWNDEPIDGINDLHILGNNGVVAFDPSDIEEINFKIL